MPSSKIRDNKKDITAFIGHLSNKSPTSFGHSRSRYHSQVGCIADDDSDVDLTVNITSSLTHASLRMLTFRKLHFLLHIKKRTNTIAPQSTKRMSSRKQKQNFSASRIGPAYFTIQNETYRPSQEKSMCYMQYQR